MRRLPAPFHAGGALGCLSVLARQGVWVPRTYVLHVRRTRQHAGRKLPPGIKDCQHRNVAMSRVTRPVDSLGQALLSAVACVGVDEAVAIMDSALNLGLLSVEELVELLADEPRSRRDLLQKVDGRSESGSESLARVRLTRQGISVTPQVEIDGVGRVDLLVGNLLVIELDSVAHHTSVRNYRADRARDALLVSRGYRVLRFTYEDVVDNWDFVERIVLTLVRARLHKGTVMSD